MRPAEGEEIEPRAIKVEAEYVAQQQGDETHAAERGDEGESEGNAGEIGGDAGEGHQRGSEPRRQPAVHDRSSEGEAENGAEKCRGGAHFNAE